MTVHRYEIPLTRHRKCLGCGWIHFGRTPAEVRDEVERFNEYFATLDDEWRDRFGGPSHVSQYQACFRCGGSHVNFRDAAEDEVPDGSTIQPIQLP